MKKDVEQQVEKVADGINKAIRKSINELQIPQDEKQVLEAELRMLFYSSLIGVLAAIVQKIDDVEVKK